MAFQFPLVETKKHYDGELVCKTAYWRVDQLAGNKAGMTITVNAYSEPSGLLLSSKQCFFVPELNTDNFIKQAYLHLKTLPEFSDAVDC